MSLRQPALKAGHAMVSFVLSLGLAAGAQTPTDLNALKGLEPVAILANTPAGMAALGANYVVTGGIQTGDVRQSTLLPFSEQQQQALRDVFITDGDLAQLADGLGSTLGAAYTARAHYIDRVRFTSLSQHCADLIAYANAVSAANAAAGKFFFANETTDGKKAVSHDAAEIMTSAKGSPDPFGRAYGRPAGTAGADLYGDSRPFQTEVKTARVVGRDYFHTPADSDVYNHGPMMDLTNSPSFPSGHTTYGYTGALVLALLVPERYQQMVVRGAEYGNDRIVIGAHYAMDVLGGRTLALYDMAHLLANDPAYLGHTVGQRPGLKNFQEALKAARADVGEVLASACGKTVSECAHEDTSRFSDPAANAAFYAATQTYDLPVVYPAQAGAPEDVGTLAPEAGYLLTAAFPALTMEQADRILTETEGPGGGFLDNGSSFGVYSRLNLYAAAARAAAVSRSSR